MLADIVKIIMEFDSQTGALMVNCFTLNEAINNILQSISETKSALNFSSRTNKKDDKQKIYDKKGSLGNNKNNNVRSTKETEDDSLKPFNDSSKQISMADPEPQPKQPPPNYLHGVKTLKSPTYINVDKAGGESPGKVQANLKKNKNEVISKCVNYSQQNSGPKQSVVVFNNTQPDMGKLNPPTREYKPIEHRNHEENINNNNNNNNNLNVNTNANKVPTPNQPAKESNKPK
jgi:hypothetical protein